MTSEIDTRTQIFGNDFCFLNVLVRVQNHALIQAHDITYLTT